MRGRGAEVAPGIHRIEAPLGDRFVACVLVVGDRETLLVDTGVDDTPAGSILPYLASIGLAPESVRWVVTTHGDVDHMGGNASFKQAVPGATLIAHRADLDLIEDVETIVMTRYSEFAADHEIDIDDAFRAWCHEVARAAPVDLVLEGSVEIRLGGRSVELFPTPGHSHGSLSVWDATTRTAIVGDAVLGATLRTVDGAPAFPPTYRYLGEYRATIAALEAREPALLLTSHEPVLDATAARAFLAESGDFTDRLDRAALADLAAAERPPTTRELVERLAPQMGDWPHGAWIFLANELIGHLEAAVADGRVRVVPGTPVRWEGIR